MAEKKTKKNTANKEESKKANAHPLILGARITEKSSMGADKGAYTFNIKKGATKNEIKKAIKALYKVEPVKVSITKVQPKKIMRGGKEGVKQGGTKAVVYLKKGDKIAFA